LLNSIQLARGLAAFLVAFLHLCNVQNDIVGRDFLSWPPFLNFGYAGVDLFFVISGFIISYVTDRGDFRASDFFLRRAIRILPIYYIFTLATWAALAVVGKAQFAMWTVIGSFAVLPMRQPPIAGGGWSLEHEAIFYLIFGLTAATLGRRAVIALLGALFAVGIALHAGPYEVWDWHLFSLFHFEFLLGVALYECRDLMAGLNGTALVTGGLLGFPATQYLLDAFFGGWRSGGTTDLWRVLGFGVSSVALIGGLLNLEERLASKVAAPAVKLGDASYVLYLSHPIILGGFGQLYARAHVGEPMLFPAMLCALVMSMAFALFFHEWCERPMLDALHRLSGRERARH
jgi:peptidoglycan/LPS O-acetylase OafA/YrhL